MATDQAKDTTKVEFCCEVFPILIPTFNWMHTQYETHYLMPHFPVKGQKWRVNHCPSCGANVRAIEIPKHQFELLFMAQFNS